MRAFKYFGHYDIREVEVDIPKPKRGELLLKMLAAGVCGTDLHIRSHGDWIGKAPLHGVTIGHEFVGEVVEIGEGTHFSQKYPHISGDIKVGSRVCAEPHVPCGSCYFCLRGQSNICLDIGHLGVTRDGAFAEYLTIPADRCSLVPEGVSDTAASLIEPLACALRAVHRSPLTVGSTVAVIGAGPMGLDVAKAARIGGASQVIVSEPDKMRRNMAEQAGCDAAVDPNVSDLAETVMELTHGIGADVVFEAAGLSETVSQAIDAVRHGGTIVQIGVPTGNIDIDIRRVIIGEISIVGEHATQWDFGAAIDLIASGKVDVESSVTHTFALEKALEAMDTAENGGSVKVVLRNFS